VVLTPLDFIGDAICLSGLTGTKLKCDVLGIYYWFWWGITSGGPSKEHRYPTAIVELNAATGEDYVEETHETVLGSAGHALQLKVEKTPHTKNLKVVLIEEHPGCYAHLKNVIRRRWPSISISEAEGPIAENSSNIYLLNKTLDEALEVMEELDVGNTLYFFDPLRSVEYETIEKVTGRRMNAFFKTGTEFIIFVFTSDWFLGRDDFAPLPCTLEEGTWTKGEKKTVSEADSLFGNTEWRSRVLNNNFIEDRERVLIEFYKHRLHKWFRYVFPMPFNPKENQVFHLILCSNFETGVRATRDFYCSKTRNPRYSPDNNSAFRRFRRLHPEIFIGLPGNKRPLQWRILWKIIREHEEGICDCMCADLMYIVPNPVDIRTLLDWLEQKGYLDRFEIENAWGSPIRQNKLNWSVLKERLEVDRPPSLTPLSPKDV
jgi:three-Cys-motif partner protein